MKSNKVAHTSYLIVEDEYYSAVELCEMMKELRPDYHFAGRTEDVEGTIDFLRNNSVDLIISDITLPDGLSFDFLRTAGGSASVIFITAYRKYKPLTAQFNTAAFLLKPVDETKLASALTAFERQQAAGGNNKIYKTIQYPNSL